MAVQQKLFLLLTTLATAIASKPTPNCSHPQVCGPLTIPYPFGTTSDCYLNEKFFISCDQSQSPPKPFLPRSNVIVLNISLDGELRVLGPVARSCYDKFGKMTTNKTRMTSFFNNSSFPISTRNKFTAVGCDTLGSITFEKGKGFTDRTCVSDCDQETREVVNGSCSGVGCCQVPIIKDTWDYLILLGSVRNHSKIHDVNPCDYAFVGEEGNYYNFSSLDIKDNLKNNESVPVLLDWAIVDKTCEKAKENVNTYACQAKNSQCVNSTNGRGYRCHCAIGYQGNPYLIDGCQDVNECETTKPCSKHCKNTEGGYECSCPLGYRGDGNKTGTGCNPTYAVLLAVSFGLLILVVGFCWIYWGMKKRERIQLKEKLFKQNGGLLFQKLRHLNAGSIETARIFTVKELRKATNNYDKTRVLGQGGHGTVYKGILADNKVVAIKKSKIVGDSTEIKQFVNEINVLSNINHRNIVRLLGCCLETEVPLLVYEFITNGTLSQCIHGRAIDHQSYSLSFEMRLKIAVETAGALAYLHSSTSMPIIHRDIKTSNILLDENYIAKISDFGASTFVPIDHCQLTTLVQGTFGYLDPEYMKSGRLTEKSDVYSFGVVLAELLTSKKAISFERPESCRYLANWFVCSLREGQLLQIVDNTVVSEENIEEVNVVAKIAEMCLRSEGKERPKMKEVATELEGIMKNKNKQREDHDSTYNSKDTEYLLKQDSEYYLNTCSNSISRFDSVENQMLAAYGGR